MPILPNTVLRSLSLFHLWDSNYLQKSQWLLPICAFPSPLQKLERWARKSKHISCSKVTLSQKAPQCLTLSWSSLFLIYQGRLTCWSKTSKGLSFCQAEAKPLEDSLASPPLLRSTVQPSFFIKGRCQQLLCSELALRLTLAPPRAQSTSEGGGMGSEQGCLCW